MTLPQAIATIHAHSVAGPSCLAVAATRRRECLVRALATGVLVRGRRALVNGTRKADHTPLLCSELSSWRSLLVVSAQSNPFADDPFLKTPQRISGPSRGSLSPGMILAPYLEEEVYAAAVGVRL